MDKILNYFNDRYSVMDGPIDMRAGVFKRPLRAFQKILFRNFDANIVKLTTF